WTSLFDSGEPCDRGRHTVALGTVRGARVGQERAGRRGGGAAAGPEDDAPCDRAGRPRGGRAGAPQVPPHDENREAVLRGESGCAARNVRRRSCPPSGLSPPPRAPRWSPHPSPGPSPVAPPQTFAPEPPPHPVFRLLDEPAVDH